MVKFHVPNQGLYLYARENAGKTELIVLNGTDREQVLRNEHYKVLTKNSLEGRNVSNGEKIDLRQHMVLSAHQSLIIEY